MTARGDRADRSRDSWSRSGARTRCLSSTRGRRRSHGDTGTAELAQAFARRYIADPARGYGRGAHEVLAEIDAGASYETAARALFHGQGSCGNGGGMRSAPIGAYFAGSLGQVVDHAARSAAP